MRKYLRNIARNNMRKAGIRHFNRHMRTDGKRTASYFAMNWRDWVNA
jgi:hypothetical protein|uniref:Uncharacterized protein n=1 Tax=Siphoviridae sp. cthu813 TaxID=2825618 RepID=A0A8S5VIJ2_9CAUD|nr:MAG TPA: hypothetical protein [Siphoviridae sp. cthu813]DAP85217.1 MAG TPA: hypothetical protein [Caudoviricetes sp.]